MATIFYTKISANGRPIFGLLVAKDNNTHLTVQVVSNAVGDSVVQINACAKKAQLGAFDANLLLGRVEYHVVACGGAPGGGTLLEAIAHEVPVPSQDGMCTMSISA